MQDILGAIALTFSATGDGLLTAAEIRTLNLQAELVVLSACDTGRSRITGDGVIGLSRSFIKAGTPSVIVSPSDKRLLCDKSVFQQTLR